MKLGRVRILRGAVITTSKASRTFMLVAGERRMGSQFFPQARCRLMALIVATLVAPRVGTPLSRSALRFQSRWGASGRIGSTSLLMSLGRHGYSNRPPGIGKGKRGSVGYRGRAGNNRRPTAASARGRRSSFGEEGSTAVGRRGGRNGAAWDGYGIVFGRSRSRSAMGKEKGSITERQYRSSRAATFSAKGAMA